MQQPPRKPNSISMEPVIAAKTKQEPAVTFTEVELDQILSPEAIDQELKRMFNKGILPSQRQKVTADVVDAFRWQEDKEAELNTMKSADVNNTQPWVHDLLEDFITYGISPAHSPDEAKIILDTLDKELQIQAEAGFGPEARNMIVRLRKELELLIEKL